ncbi:MAG: helix-turn-helix transcriptional regulator [Mangrovibacterium sp.]|nr:helix-turn-helix transcriptional regulator [Mangrovibacterium sp.]
MKITELQRKIGEKIRMLRESKGISQQNLAAICNFEKANLSRIESGRTNPTVSTLYKISQALEVSLSEIVDVESASPKYPSN